VWSGLLIRQARLRRGLSQEEFAQRIGRDRAVVVRWERGVNRPTYDTLREVLGAVGFDLPPRLVDLGEEPGTEHDGFLRRLRETPQERLAEARDRAGRCEPWRIIAALDQHRTAYVFVGVLAAVIHGSGERAAEVEIVPRVRADNLARVALALADLASPDIVVDSERSSTSYPTSAGALRISIAPPGSGGYDDLRRQAAREPIGEGARPLVASLADLLRIAEATPGDEAHANTLRMLVDAAVGANIDL
jgi:transcriptional regulator with XRE-family HTH domain